MKLLIVLSVIACSYAAKLDRTYLPPASAATAGGSPGSLNAPPGNFGSPSGRGNGFQPLEPAAGSAGPSSSGSNGAPSGPSSFGSSSGPSNFGTSRPLNFGQSGSSGQSGFGQAAQGGQTSNNYGQAAGGFGQQSAGFNQGGSFNQPQGQGGFSGQRTQQPERAQTAGDRNAEILKYENQNDGETFSYSFETSNGISAEESGVATNGVQAQGGYSYTGDDGQFYRVTYTADENGYLPQGDHLPTPPPVPEEILRSIEKNAAAAAAGTQEGAYNPNEDNEDIPQQFNAGSSAINQPQGGRQGQQGGAYNQGGNQMGGAFNQGGNKQGGAFNQGSTQSVFGGSQQGGAFGQGNAQGGSFGGSQQGNQQGTFNQGTNSGLGRVPQTQGPSSQNNQGSSFNQGSYGAGQYNQGSGFSGNRAQSGQIQGDNGYEYNRPQAQFGGQSQGPANQYNRPQSNSRPSISKPSRPAQVPSGPQGPSGFGQSSSPAGPAGPSQTYNKPTQSRPQTYNQGSQSSGSAFSRPSSPSAPSQGSFGGQYNQASQSGSQGPSGSFNRPAAQGSFNQVQQAAGGNQGLIQAPYQYDRPSQQRPQGGSQSIGSQGPQGSRSQGLQGQSSSGPGPQGPSNQGRGQTFGGPRQPPSFNEQEGYKY